MNYPLIIIALSVIAVSGLISFRMPISAYYRKLEVWQQSAVWIVLGFILMVTILYGPWY